MGSPSCKHFRTKLTNLSFFKELFTFGPCEKWGQSKKVEGRGCGRGRGKKGMLVCKPLDFENPVRPKTGLPIGAAWSS